MLRINLLPAYIAERRKVTTAIVLAVLLFLIATAVPLAIALFIINPQVTAKQAEAADMKQKAEAETTYESATSTLRSQVAPLANKVTFVEAVQFNNRIRQRIFRNAAKFTYRKVEYDAMSISGNILSVSATVSSLGDIGRFYILMFGNPDVTAVSISGVPGWADVARQEPVVTPGGPAPVPPSYRIAMNATLIKSLAPPSLPAELSAGGAAGAGPAAGPGGPPAGLGAQ